MIVPVVDELDWRALLDGLPVWQPPAVRTVVLAPHPDDETLAAGGLIRALRAAGTAVTVVAVTDGERAYGETPGLGAIREVEQTEALAALGVAKAEIVRLRLPDSDVGGCEELLVERLMPLVDGETHLVAPWPGDFHPDHEACGRAADTVARSRGARLTFYFFWTWHRGETGLLQGLELVRFPLGVDEQVAKQRALACHVSQLEEASGSPILPEGLLAPARRPYEVFLPC